MEAYAALRPSLCLYDLRVLTLCFCMPLYAAKRLDYAFTMLALW